MRAYPSSEIPTLHMAEPAKTRRRTTDSAADAAGGDVVALPGTDEPRADVVRLPEPNSDEVEAYEGEPHGDSRELGDGAALVDATRAGGEESLETSDVARALRRAREGRGVSLADAAEATCITASYLSALENDEPVSSFPAPAYARFFLREYAQYLGLDADELVDRFGERHGIAEETLVAPDAPAIAPRSRWPVRVLAAVSVALLLLLAAFAIGRSASRDTGIMPLPSASVNAGEERAAGDQGNASEPREGGANAGRAARERNIRAELRVLEPTWLRVTADGTTTLSDTLDPGRSYPLRAEKELTIYFGNAPGVRLTVNGERVDTGDVSVATFDFALRRGRIVQHVT